MDTNTGIGTTAGAPVTDEHVAAWRRDGYVVIPDFLTPAEVERAVADVAAYRPTWAEIDAAPHRYPAVFGEARGFDEFPYQGDTLNAISVHPELMRTARRILGTDEIALATSLLWAKYAGLHDFEQELHADYRNNTLVHPREDGVYVQIPFILYLTDVDTTMGPTYVVPRQHTDGEPAHVNRRGRATHPDLYRYETPVTATAGSLLMYTMSTFHRGSAITATSGHRYTMHMVYRAAQCQWMGWRAWARYADGPEMARFMVRATPEQRCLLGVPAPGDAYWDATTIEGVAARYPGIDMTPYVAGVVS